MSRDARTTERPRLLAYGAAVLAVVVATLLRMALTPLIGSNAVPFITFFPAVLFSAWYGGFRVGALSILLSALAADYYFVAPVGSLRFVSAADQITLLIFVLVGFGMALLSGSQRRAVEQANREASRRRDAEIAERTQRQQLGITLASIGDAVLATDAEGRVVFANRVALSLLRWPEAEVVGRHLDETFRIINEYTRAKVESPVTKVLREGAIVGMANHTILIAGDGTEIPIDDSGAPIRGESGAIEGTVLVFRDVTGRKEAEERFHKVVEAAPSAMIMVGGGGLITLVNDQTEKLFGYERGELIGQPVETLVPERYRGGHGALRGSFFQAPSARAMGTGRDLFGVRKDGSEVPVEIGLNPIRIGQEDLVLAAIIDISERKKAEKELLASNEALSRSNEALERFAFIASHDLQEPLRMITAYSQLLVKAFPGELDKDVAMFVDNITGGTKRMRTLLADLLAYTEINLGPAEPAEAEAVDLNLVIENVRQNLKPSIDESGAVITSDPLPTLAAYPVHFVPLFQNLVGNAIKYRSESPPRIHISVQKTEGQFRFAVADNGIGIDPEYHEKIFEVFKRLHGKTIPGTGVGLAICQRVVERYGGRIWVESQAGQGATFLFTFPAVAVYSAGKN